MKPLFLLASLLFSAVFSLHSHAQLIASDASVRAMPPGQPNTAAFLSLSNTGGRDIRLVSAATSVSKKAEYHSHTKDDKGVMRMAKEAFVEIKAGETFVFKTGGHHIMIMGLKKALKPGENVDMVLTDSNGTEYSFTFPVVSIMAEQPSQDHSHHHHH